MKKKYICPTVLIVNVEKDALLAGSPIGPANWADTKGDQGGFIFDDDFSDDLIW